MARALRSLALLVLALGGGWLAITTLAPASWIARGAPCPRNWGWGPAWGHRASPLSSIEFALGEQHAKLCYGRPSLDGRQMIGGEQVPFGQLWRTGANEPTTIHFDGPVVFGELPLAQGSYSIYTVPDVANWEIVVNRSIRQWGLESEYTPSVRALEVGRFVVPIEVLDTPVETLTFHALPSATGSTDLVFEWQTTRLHIPIEAGLGQL